MDGRQLIQVYHSIRVTCTNIKETDHEQDYADIERLLHSHIWPD